jgi:hypothetical protein
MPLDQAVGEALAWLGDDDPGRREGADVARWRQSPWTVFGWSTDASPGESGVELSGVPGRVGNGGSRVYGEGGAVPPR